ncbi:gamma-glutamylcyclotransferase [bacterium SCSIO 12827]|nr:gamma-glutamylcyclotransferase [bacterium SCSIO 12827]
MLSFFFYGTLMDSDLQAVVLGGRLPTGVSAVLDGYHRRTVAGQGYPAIALSRNSQVSGLLVGDISPVMAARASLYEGPQYTATSLTVTTEDGTPRRAWTFLPVADVRLSARDWSLHAWQRRRKTLTLKSANTHMTAIRAGALRRNESDWITRLRDSRRP